MKKINLMILAFLIGFSSISLAADHEEVNKATLVYFSRDFKNATSVSWTQTSTCYKATFYFDGQVMYAYYNKDESGLVAVTRNILPNQLPINLQQGLHSKLGDGWISELFEVDSGGETSYYATVENGSFKLGYKSSGFADWSRISKAKK